MTPQGPKVGTVFVDTFSNSTPHQRHEPVMHNSETVARTYAAAVSGRRKCRIDVFVGNRLVAMYENGAEVGAVNA